MSHAHGTKVKLLIVGVEGVGLGRGICTSSRFWLLFLPSVVDVVVGGDVFLISGCTIGVVMMTRWHCPSFLPLLRNHGATNIPPRGLAMLRLYPLEPWHARNGYAELESADDKETKK